MNLVVLSQDSGESKITPSSDLVSPEAVSEATRDKDEDSCLNCVLESAVEIYSREGCKIYFVNQIKDSCSPKAYILKKTPVFESGSQKNHQEQEIEFYKLLQEHPKPHLLNILDLKRKSGELEVSMEFACGGDLDQYIRSAEFQQEIGGNFKKKVKWVKKVIKEVINGLKEIHDMGFVYRDLKPSNIVITHDKNIKLCDYGLVGKLNTLDDSFCGTPEYMAPERLTERRNKLSLDYSVDIWSLGILAYELLLGETPFNFDENIASLVEQIYNNYIPFSSHCPPQYRNFILNLLQINSKKRLNYDKIISHAVFSGIEDERPLFNSTCKCNNQ